MIASDRLPVHTPHYTPVLDPNYRRRTEFGTVVKSLFEEHTTRSVLNGFAPGLIFVIPSSVQAYVDRVNPETYADYLQDQGGDYGNPKQEHKSYENALPNPMSDFPPTTSNLF